MHILLSNDDGIDAPGLDALARVLCSLGEVTVVAPRTEQSAKSHALTMHAPLRASPRGERRWAVSGTPADCVYLALHHLCERPPDLVVSGINRGSNLGNDVLYSGTVAAAMEGCLQGLPAVATSLHLPADARQGPHWETAAAATLAVVRGVLAHGIGTRRVLNVNVPNVPLCDLRGTRATRLGVRRYAAAVDERVDPRGRRYFWIGGEHVQFEPVPNGDGQAVEQGFVSVTPLRPDWTDDAYRDTLASWVQTDAPPDRPS